MTDHTMCSVAGHVGPAVRVSSTSGFHRFFATKPVRSETNKAEPRSSGDHSSIGDFAPNPGPIAIFSNEQGTAMRKREKAACRTSGAVLLLQRPLAVGKVE